MKLLNRLFTVFRPDRMYKFNVGMVFVNLILALITIGMGLNPAFTQIFLASALCFIVGGLTNWWIMRIQDQKSADKQSQRDNTRGK